MPHAPTTTDDTTTTDATNTDPISGETMPVSSQSRPRQSRPHTARLGASRRTVLKGTAAATALGGLELSGHGLTGSMATAGAAPTAHSAPGQLAVVFLRGGMDGLSAVVPYTEAAYHDARPTIRVPENQVLDLDGQFGMHPSMGGLHGLFGQGRLAIAVGTGNPAGDRSHFVAQDLWEYGTAGGGADGRGWVGRHLGATGAQGDSLFRGLTIGNLVNASLRGGPALGVPSINRFGLVGAASRFSESIVNTYEGARPIEVTGQTSLAAIDQVAGVGGSNSTDPVAASFADAASLFASGLGVEAITLDIGHWDTHDEMGTWDEGEMNYLLSDLDTQLSTFQADLDARGLNNVTTVVMSEFGRRVEENGSRGTDHGWGSHMFVMGSQVNGGVFGASDWAGLAPGVIGRRGDVVPSIDFRDVLGDLVTGVLGGNLSTALPGHSYSSVGVI